MPEDCILAEKQEALNAKPEGSEVELQDSNANLFKGN